MKVIKNKTSYFGIGSWWYIMLLPNISIGYDKNGLLGRELNISIDYLFWSYEICFYW